MQGRRQIDASAVANYLVPRAVILAGVVLALVLLLCGCIRTYHERDGKLIPNKPSPKELRTICPL